MSLHYRVERYLRASRMPPSRFGRLVANDPALVSGMRCGRRLGSRLVAKIEGYLAAQGAA